MLYEVITSMLNLFSEAAAYNNRLCSVNEDIGVTVNLGAPGFWFMVSGSWLVLARPETMNQKLCSPRQRLPITLLDRARITSYNVCYTKLLRVC